MTTTYTVADITVQVDTTVVDGKTVERRRAFFDDGAWLATWVAADPEPWASAEEFDRWLRVIRG